MYTRKVNLGASIGTSRLFLTDDGRTAYGGYGTFGCYVEIKTTDTPEWTRCALTNYHVARSSLDGIPQRRKAGHRTYSRISADATGFPHQFWEADKGIAALTAPPLCTYKEHVVELRQELVNGIGEPGTSHCDQDDQSFRKQTQSSINRKVAFIETNKHMFGFPCMGSGYHRRTRDNHMLDWALICGIPLDRQGSNILPTYSAWTGKYAKEYCPRRSACGVSLKGPSTRPLCDMKCGELVFKVGARSGITAGYYSNESPFTIGKSQVAPCTTSTPSSEHIIRPHPTLSGGNEAVFVKPGDSGSVVFNEFGEILGLICWGKPNDFKGYEWPGYLTPIEDVFKDMKEISEGVVTDIRIPL